MLQELFRIPFIDRPVYGYGLMMVLGFLAATQLAKFLAKRYGYNGEHFVNAALIALVSGVIGARLSHVLENLLDPRSHEFSRNGHSLGENLLAMLNVSSGGLTFYGGFLLATPVLIFYAIRKRIPVLHGMDLVAPCLMVGLAFGRVGCYLNGCCYGEECSLSWGAEFPYGSNAFVEQYERGEISVPDPLVRVMKDGRTRLLSKEEIRGHGDLESVANSLRAKPVQPTELYSAFNALFIAGVTLAFLTTAPRAGRVFALMLLLKGASRYVLEMIRVEPAIWGRQSFSMLLSMGLFTVGAIMWFAVGFGRRVDSGNRLSPALA